MQQQEQQEGDEHERLLRRACDAALRNDATSLLEHLQCRVSSSHHQLHPLTSPLLKSTKQAKILHQRLFYQGDSQRLLLREGCRPDHMLRALLMVPPSFETPWAATLEFALLVQVNENLGENNGTWDKLHASSIRSCIADIQSFLQQTVAMWWEKERRWNATNSRVRSINAHDIANANNKAKTTPRDWILRLTKTLIQPLLQQQSEGKETSNPTNTAPEIIQARRSTQYNKQSWMVPLELVATIVSTMHDFEQSLKQELLDSVFQLPTLRPDRLLPWLSLAMDLHPFLRPCDWNMLIFIFQGKDEVTQQYTAFSIPQDLPGLMSSIVNLSSALLEGGGRFTQTLKRDLFKSWRALALHLLIGASKEPSTFSTVATVLQSGLSALPTSTLREWMNFDNENILFSRENSPDCTEDEVQCTTTCIPKWIWANLILIVMQAAKKSGSQVVNRHLSIALSRKGSNCWDLGLEGWNSIVGLLAFSTKDKREKKGGRSAGKSMEDTMNRWLKGVSYAGHGCFYCDEESTSSFLNQMGSLVYQSLFLVGSCEGRNVTAKNGSKIYLLERAQGWINAANDRLKATTGHLSTEDAILIAIILVIIFCEVPKSRSFVVRGILRALVGEMEFLHSKTDLALLHCHAIAVIIKSKSLYLPDADIGEIKPIFDSVATAKVPQKVFFGLVDAISTSSEAADAALLSACRKHLNCFTGCLWWGDHSSSENSERIKCGLYALCNLVTSTKWNTCTAEAWKMLSERIVLNTPPLPLAARSWLFRQLRVLVESKMIKPEAPVMKRVLRACLLRLFQYAVQKVDKITFSAEKVLATWGASNAGSMQSTLIEDIPELLLLVFEILFAMVSMADCKTEKVVMLGRKTLCQACLIRESKDMFSMEFLLDASDILVTYFKLAIYFMESAIGFVSHCSYDNQVNNHHFGASIKTTPGSIRGYLVAQERREFESFGLGHQEEKYLRPSWLDVSQSSELMAASNMALPKEAVRSLALTITRVVSNLIEDYRWEAFEGNKSNVDSRRDVLLSLNFLSSCEAKFAGGEIMNVSEHPYSGIATTEKTLSKGLAGIGATLSSSSLVLEDGIMKEKDFEVVSHIISAVLERLEILANYVKRAESFTGFANGHLSTTLYGLWNLYDCLCEESAAVRFISYVENIAMAEAHSVQVTRSETQVIDSPEEVDSLIRHIRYSVLVALKTCLSLLHQEECLAAISHKSYEMLDRNDSTTIPVDFMALALQKLASDLRIGLEGRSGGITTEMYISFIESMDEISKILGLFATQTKDANVLLGIRNSCRESESRVQSALCAYSLPKKSALFHKAFSLCTQSIPRTLRRTKSAAAFLAQKALKENTSCSRKNMFAVETFKGCMETLRSWLGSKKPSDTSWANVYVTDTAVDNNSRLDDDSSESGDSVVRMRDVAQKTGVPTIVTISHSNRSSPNNISSLIDSDKRLLLDTKDIWNRACSGALVAMEKSWSDAYGAVQHVEGRGLMLKFPLSSSVLEYINQRTEELKCINEVLSFALSPYQTNVVQGSKAKAKDADVLVSTEFLAEILPLNSKVKLCALLDRMAITLASSLKLMECYIRQPTYLHTGPVLVEALCSILACCNSGDADSFNFAIQTRLWYTAEQRRVQVANKNNSTAENAGILGHFLKVLSRIQKLELLLHRLLKTLSSAGNTSKSNAQSEQFARIHEINKTVVKAIIGTSNSFSLSEMLDMELTKMSKARSDLAKTNLRAVAGDNYTYPPELGKRKLRQQQRKSRKRQLRSRNQTVDKWLLSDLQVGEDESVDDDAYVDLEDFLVEG